MCQRRRCTAADNGRGFVDECVILKGLDHEQGVVYSARDVVGKIGITYVATPHGQTLALAFFKVAATNNCPSRVAGKHPLACFHLIVDVHDAG